MLSWSCFHPDVGVRDCVLPPSVWSNTEQSRAYVSAVARTWSRVCVYLSTSRFWMRRITRRDEYPSEFQSRTVPSRLDCIWWCASTSIGQIYAWTYERAVDYTCSVCVFRMAMMLIQCRGRYFRFAEVIISIELVVRTLRWSLPTTT